MSEEIKQPSNEWEVYTHKIVREQVGALLQSDYADEVSEVLKNTKNRLLDQHEYAELEQSPYYHALLGSSPKKTLVFNPSNLQQKKIAEVVIGSLKWMHERFETTTPTVFQKNIEAYLETLDKDLRAIVMDRLRIKVRGLQAQYPSCNLNSIPEVQFIIGGSEVTTSTELPHDVITSVMEELTREYVTLVENISKIGTKRST